jgi:hypothetical protein
MKKIIVFTLCTLALFVVKVLITFGDTYELE